jgi:hypothetical protein
MITDSLNASNETKFVVLDMGNHKTLQTDDYSEVVKKLICENFYDLSKADRKAKIKNLAEANVTFKNLELEKNGSSERLKVRDTYNRGEDISNTIYTCDEKAYILSLVNTNTIMLFERVDSHSFMGDTSPKNYEIKYCVLNKHISEVLPKHLSKTIDEPER